jgi:hypothetical protein
MSVIALPIIGIGCRVFLSRGWYGLVILCALLFVSALAFNLWNAIGGLSIARDTTMTERRSARSSEETVRSEMAIIDDRLQGLRKASKDATPAMVGAIVMGLKANPIYNRSKGCTDVTLDDSKLHCNELALAVAQEKAAEEVGKLQARRSVLSDKLENAKLTGQDDDVQTANVVRALGVDASLTLRISSWASLAGAFIIELLSGLMPAVIEGILAGRRKPDGPTKPHLTSPELPAEQPASDKDLVQDFLNEVTMPGGKVGSTPLYKAFCSWCEGRYTIPNQRNFGLLMTELGHKREKGKHIAYVGISLRKPTLTLAYKRRA